VDKITHMRAVRSCWELGWVKLPAMVSISYNCNTQPQLIRWGLVSPA
jgi:hypothetical protein